MNRSRFVLNVFAAFTIVFAFSVLAQAQATRTWVSGVGDDVNPCSRTAPCKTFAGAISKTAAGGEINVIDAGAFGAVTITKGMTIDATPFPAGVLASGTNGIIVNAGVNDSVTLRGLDIHGVNGAPSGIKFIAGKSLTVDHCVVFGFTNGIDIQHPSAASFTSISDTIIRDNSNAGIQVYGGSGATASMSVVRSLLTSNFIGLQAVDFSLVTAYQTVASNNGHSGFRAVGNTGATADLTLSNCQSTHNARGVLSQNVGSVPNIRLDNVSVVSNTGTGLEIAGTANIATFGNNRIVNNLAGSAAPNVTISPAVQ